jgi:cobalt-zinc-cadmium efflux system membrane fusion protein
MTRVTAFTIASVLIVLVQITGCKESPSGPAAAGPKVEGESITFPPGNIQFKTLQLAQVQAAAAIKATLTGRLVWDEDRTARIYPAFSGKVSQILVKAGDRVHAGQALALIASPDFGQAQSDAQRSITAFDLASKSLERARALSQHGVMAQKDVQTAEADYHNAQTERHRAERRLALYGSGTSIDQRYPLVSPIAGVVVERNINPGEELRSDMGSSNAPAMFVVTDPAHLWVQLDASEKDLPFVAKGVGVALESAAYPGETFPATIVAVSDFLDPTTRTIKVRGTVDNAARRLKGEMFIAADMPRKLAGALQVPASAVYLRGDKNFVFVVTTPGHVTRRQVTIGPSQDSMVIILSGLRQGETVIASGSLLLQQMLSDALNT